MIEGDRAQMLQLLDNLISNAIRYGRAAGTIRVGAVASRGTVEVTVADEGEGVAAEHIPRLTERFYRVDPSRSRLQGGTGLGLSIVKHIVERHRGRLVIESQPGKGTAVRVFLPIAPSRLSEKGHVCGAVLALTRLIPVPHGEPPARGRSSKKKSLPPPLSRCSCSALVSKAEATPAGAAVEPGTRSA